MNIERAAPGRWPVTGDVPHPSSGEYLWGRVFPGTARRAPTIGIHLLLCGRNRYDSRKHGSGGRKRFLEVNPKKHHKLSKLSPATPRKGARGSSSVRRSDLVGDSGEVAWRPEKHDISGSTRRFFEIFFFDLAALCDICQRMGRRYGAY
jgi:hypothetical protein